MDEHILAAAGRLDESVTLGRDEPLHSTLSHSQVSAGLKQSSVPGNRLVRLRTRYAISARLDRSNTGSNYLNQLYPNTVQFCHNSGDFPALLERIRRSRTHLAARPGCERGSPKRDALVSDRHG